MREAYNQRQDMGKPRRDRKGIAAANHQILILRRSQHPCPERARQTITIQTQFRR